MFRSTIHSLVAALALLPCLAFAGPIDINTASAEQLSEGLLGIGPQKAAAIVAYREQNGPYRSAADLTKVKGIGDNVLEKNRDLISFGQAEATASQ
ncbi:MAG: ComEA family DNA-binding protein [Thiohalobacteraceae bacterium]